MRWPRTLARVAFVALLCACSSAAPRPRSEPAPRGSHAEWLPARAEPASIEALDEEVARLVALAEGRERPGLVLLRLADALLERAGAHGREELVAVEAAFVHRENIRAREAAEARAETHREARVEDLTRARRVLETIGADWPEAERARAALFWLLAERREWLADALAAARVIVEGERSGRLLAAAHLRLGEAAFLEARLAEALTHYDAVLATEGADVETVAFASYKRAWVLTNLERFPEADRAFARTLELVRGRANDALAREAAKDRLRLQIALGSPPGAVLAIIEEATDDAALRARLAQRFEQMLRDAGELARAEAFRERLLR